MTAHSLLKLGARFFFAGMVFSAVGAGSSERRYLSGHIPRPAIDHSPLRRLEPTNRLSLAISLPLRNREALATLLEELYNPASPNYRHYLGAEEFARRFGPAAEDYSAVQQFCQAQGLTIDGLHANRAVLDVTGPAGSIEKAFQTTLQIYSHPTENRTFFAPSVEPSVATNIPILHIQGLDNLHPPRPLLKRMAPAETARVVPNLGSGTNGSFLGKDFRAAYAPGVALTGSGQSVALVEFDGYYTNDIVSYEKAAGLHAVALQNVPIGGYNGRAGSGNGEVALDIQMAISMAPGLQKVLVYEASPNSAPNGLLNRMATDKLANQISCSWTWGTYDPGTDQIFQQFAAQGQSYLQASGDGGAYVGAIDAPADHPYATVVGGTTLSTSGQGNWVSETVWSYGSGTGSGGGYSTLYGRPAWQAGIDMSANLGSTSWRNVPDVALIADNVENIADNGQVYQITGTSIAAPLWAGFIALANEQATAAGLPVLGWLNPTLYALGKSTNYAKAFHDITIGDNTTPASPNKYPATANYDLCTGWGTPAGSNTIKLLLQVANSQVDHFTWAPIDTSLLVGSPRTVTLTAETISNSLASSFSGTVSLSANETQTNSLFFRDFENTTLSDWVSEGGTYTRMIDTTTGAAGTSSSLTLVGGDGASSYNGLSHSLANLSPDRIDFYVKSLATNTASGYFVAGAAKYRTNSVFHFRLDSTGAMGLTDGPGNFYGVPYTPNEWFHIRLQLNWAAKVIDYYVNDKLAWPNIPFCNTSLNSLAVINLYNFDNTQAWWDQIRLTKNLSTVLAVTPVTSGNFTNGRWTGAISLGQSATNLIFLAVDNAGHIGLSNPFDSIASTPSSVTVTATADPVEGGTVTGSGHYPVGSQQVLAALSAANWVFTQWLDGSTSNPRTITVPSTNVSYTAIFAKLTVRPSFGPVVSWADQKFTFSLEVASGSTAVIQVSTNLQDWLPLTTLRTTNALSTFTDTNATAPWRFYRLSLTP